MSAVLGLGTYPIMRPIHGGQRRVAAIRNFYAEAGIRYSYACVYAPAARYKPDELGPDDVILKPGMVGVHRGVPFIEDMLSGLQAASEARTFGRFCDLIDREKPDAIQLEQPFMWPFVRRLRQETRYADIPVIYSSQNIEGSLKYAILHDVGVSLPVCRAIEAEIDDLEKEICRAAALVIAVTPRDAEYYRSQGGAKVVRIANNGVERPPARVPDSAFVQKTFGRNRFLFFVGSAYPPNVKGFCDLVAEDGIFFCPPVKSLAICGGVSDGIVASASYQAFRDANSSRVQIFSPVSDEALCALKAECHGVLLPINTGGGSNLKTAEALALGKWVIATPTALRSFDAFAEDPNVVVAEDLPSFKRAAAQTLRAPVPVATAEMVQRREGLYWDRCLAAGGLRQAVEDVLVREDGSLATPRPLRIGPELVLAGGTRSDKS